MLFVEHGESRDGGDGSVESGEAVAAAGGEDSPVFEVRVSPFDGDADDHDRGVVFEVGFGAVLAGLFLVRCGHVAAW